jgi:hypothetical protein
MGCCNKGRSVKVPKEQQKIVKVVNTSGAKSNRSSPGTLLKQCSVCNSTTISTVCPVCGNKL